jgi:hypothetical protein
MAWSLEGTYFENCPCDMVCPCTTSGLTKPADAERCRVVLVFHIDSGEVDGVDVSRLTVAVLADTPQVMADGNWRVGVFMDEDATQEQADKLGAVFSGQLGGPMEALSGLIGENLGVEVAPIEYEDVAYPIDSSTLFPCPICHNPTLQHYRLPSVTRWSGERTSENSVMRKFNFRRINLPRTRVHKVSSRAPRLANWHHTLKV